jgi:hypothetical protein
MRDWSLRAGVDGMRDRLRLYDERFTGEEIAAQDAARVRADSVLNLWGAKASQPLPGEACRDYRRRLLRAVQEKSPKFRGKTLSTGGDALDFVEEQIYADAATAAFDPSTVPPGQMRAIRQRDESGRLITSWIGNDYMADCWDAFTQAGARGSFNRNIADKAR